MISEAFQIEKRSIENPETTDWANPANWLTDFFGGGPSKSGVSVNQDSAVRMSAVWRAVRLLSETIASLPLFVYQRQDPRGRVRVTDHPLSELLHLIPNPNMSSLFVKEMIHAFVVLHGNGYAALRRDGTGQVREIWPLVGTRVSPHRLTTGELVYVIKLGDGTSETWRSGNILHIPGLSFDGLKGRSVIGAARDAIGLGLAAQDYGATLFSRGGRIPGVIETPQATLTPDQRKNLEESWSSQVGGTDNWHKIAILTRGMKYQTVGVPPEDAQWLQLRNFQVTEIARLFGVQPHLLYDLSRATFSNIEQQGLEFVIYTLRPQLVRWEQELNRKLLTSEERASGLFIEFNIDALLRGDSAARSAFYTIGRQWGYLSANDVRDRENLPGLGDKGDVYMIPFNMGNAEDLVSTPGGDPLLPPPDDDAIRARRDVRTLTLRRRIKQAQKPIIEDHARVVVAREVGAVRKLLSRLAASEDFGATSQKFKEELERFYEDHAAWATKRMQPLIRSYAELVDAALAEELGSGRGQGVSIRALTPELDVFATTYSERFGTRHANDSRNQILALLEEENPVELIEQRLTEWEEKRPAKIATREAVQFMAAATKVAMVASGVTLIRWVANAEACPFCSELDGQVVGVEKDFVGSKQPVDGGAGQKPMKPSHNVGHPPLHNGCECDIVAG